MKQAEIIANLADVLENLMEVKGELYTKGVSATAQLTALVLFATQDRKDLRRAADVTMPAVINLILTLLAQARGVKEEALLDEFEADVEMIYDRMVVWDKAAPSGKTGWTPF